MFKVEVAISFVGKATSSTEIMKMIPALEDELITKYINIANSGR